VVGLPCQIHGIRKAAKLDRRVRERIAITIGLFCHAAVEHEPMRYIWDKIPADKDQIEKFVSRIGKHPGTPHIILKDGSSQPVYFPKAKGFRPSSMEIINILYRLYTPGRCLTCYDSTSEFADISVGDPWMIPPDQSIDFRDGYSFALARTEVGQNYLKKAQEQGYLLTLPLDDAQARSSNRMMGVEKRLRAFRVMETRRRQGCAVPEYGFEAPRASGWEFIATEINMFTHMFCFLKRGRKAILKLTFSPLGYGALWLNNKKRVLRYWLKAKKVQAK
jgi:coenzyme F420 hydrogenase subunit beta